MQNRDRMPVGEIEHDPDHRRLVAEIQAEHMVIGPRATEILSVVPGLGRRKLPDVGVKARCLGEIAAHKFDAAHAANEARRHSQAATARRRLSPSADLALA